MIFTAICLTWAGIQLQAPVWYYVVLVTGLLVRMATSTNENKK